MTNSIPIREALRKVFHKYSCAKDTSNRELQSQCREFIREYWPKRNQSLSVFMR